jgi:hypothetical protein
MSLNQLIGFAVQQELGQGFAVETLGDKPALFQRPDLPFSVLFKRSVQLRYYGVKITGEVG